VSTNAVAVGPVAPAAKELVFKGPPRRPPAPKAANYLAIWIAAGSGVAGLAFVAWLYLRRREDSRQIPPPTNNDEPVTPPELLLKKPASLQTEVLTMGKP
jgi:hypothetical protein